jgi:hypothetical protein
LHRHSTAIHEQRILVHQADSGERRRLDVADSRRHLVAKAARLELREECREKIEMQRDAEGREVDVDGGDLLKAYDMWARVGDLVCERSRPRRQGGLLERNDRGHESGLIVRGVWRDERGDDGVHIGTDVHVPRHEGYVRGAGVCGLGHRLVAGVQGIAAVGRLVGTGERQGESCGTEEQVGAAHGRLRWLERVNQG